MNMKYAMRSEDTEQINVVSWANWNMNRYPELRWLSKNEAEDVIGDAWTADMIAHFFGYLKRDMEKKQEETK